VVITDARIYEVRIIGVMPDSALECLDDVDVARQEMRTVLSGRFVDQAALYGFLQRLRSLGLEVVEVREVVARPEPSGQPNPDRPESAGRPDPREGEPS
jgi:hypothetical protein